MSLPPLGPNNAASPSSFVPPILPPSYPFSSFASPSLALSVQARALLPLVSPPSASSLRKRRKRSLHDFLTPACPTARSLPSSSLASSASPPASVTDQRFQFSFESSLDQQKQEEGRLLNEQGISRADCVSGRQWGRHTVVCRHWWKGMCMKGEFCDFLHQLIYHRMPACRNQLCCPDTRRGCCPFRHEEAGAPAGGTKPPAGPSAPATGDGAAVAAGGEGDDGSGSFGATLPDFTSTDYVSGGAGVSSSQQECVNYFLGFCKHGPKCRRRHTARNRRDVPSILPTWFLDQILANPQVFPTELDSESEDQLARVVSLCRQLAQASRGSAPAPPVSSHASLSSFSTAPAGASLRGGADPSRGASMSESQAAEKERSAFRSSFSSAAASAGAASAAFPSGAYAAAGTQREGAFSSAALLVPSTTCVVPLLVDPLGQAASPQSTKRFFIIKSNRMSNIYTSVQHGVWATSKGNTRKLINAFTSTDHVLLLFSANESGGFQGFGRMMTLPDAQLFPGIWGPVQLRLGGNFRVMWLKQCKVEFEELGKVTNPWNEDLPLRKSRDGTEVPPALGSLLCTWMAQRPSEDLLAGTGIDAATRIDHSAFFTMLLQNKLLSVPPSGTVEGTLQPTAPIELRGHCGSQPQMANGRAGGVSGGDGGQYGGQHWS
ncbi:YT521-B-like family protein, related [Neospora caninum Liverpool]|uniref:YT521-B-like family protein, related n=1 Tax=Neospora caninum (strain Liverpool) TaxID=572307 RepID=F0VFN9_NEOCL|nr:YT521-B-like family protein, related [Neospora caninum Liverpool]CBZ52533.1 YT521-B-like family protein, related [Neospora caninum Liverpool]CEL66509.1 TPA: YT521-B-like family protein, related [Neospora caninum Liverpool]|eukprot:XP_003882565.1 YT521-B-like family protein, related [Neospora caninum Liverpool]